MSITDEISRIKQAKVDIKQALETKGVTVGDGLIDTYASKIDEIETGTKITGSTELLAKAMSNIQKGDVCSLTDAIGGFEAMETRTLPANAKEDSTTVMIKNAPLKLDNEGKLILVQKYSGNYDYYPFCLVNGEYVQMTVDGSLTILPYGYVPAKCYDETSNIFVWANYTGLKVYHIDFETRNIELLATTTGLVSGYNLGGCLVAHNNNFIVPYVRTSSPQSSSSRQGFKMYKYDSTANILTELTGAGSGKIVNSFSVIGDDLYVASQDGGYIYFNYYKFNTGTGQFEYQKNFYSPKGIAGNNNYGMNMDASLIIYRNTNDKLIHGLKINKSAISSTDMTFTFSDGLDGTKVTSLTMVRNSKFLYVYTTDTTTYSAEEQLRLYEYDVDTGVCTFICCPAQSFSPVTASSEVPQYLNLIDGDYTICLNSNSVYTMYKVGYATREYDVIATSCNNTLVDGANGYGIAKENILVDETGKIEMIVGGI